MNNSNYIFGIGLLKVHVDQRSAKIFASEHELAPIIVNASGERVDAEKGLDLAPSKRPSSAGNPA